MLTCQDLPPFQERAALIVTINRHANDGSNLDVLNGQQEANKQRPFQLTKNSGGSIHPPDTDNGTCPDKNEMLFPPSLCPRDEASGSN